MTPRDPIAEAAQAALNAMPEEWRPVASHPGKYEVSNHGRVRGLKRRRLMNLRLLGGYMEARLSGPEIGRRVHRLVAEAFIPNPLNKPVVNHIDCDRTNNLVTNLEWCTVKENIHHSARLGRSKFGASRVLTYEQAAEVREIRDHTGLPASKIAPLFGVSKGTIEKILQGALYVCPNRFVQP